MSKRDPVSERGERAGPEALPDPVVVRVQQCIEQPHLRARGGDRRCADGVLPARAQRGYARENGVSDRLGNLAGASGEHFGHEERVARGHPEELVRIRTVGLSDLRHARG